MVQKSEKGRKRKRKKKRKKLAKRVVHLVSERM